MHTHVKAMVVFLLVLAAAAQAVPQERILFTAHYGSSSQLWLARPDGTDLVQLTAAAGHNMNGCLSPDGKEVAFVSSRDGSTRVYLMNVATRAATPIYTAAVASPEHAELAWSPVAEAIAVKLVLGTTTRIAIIDRAGNVLHSRDLSGRSNVAFSWSGDGQYLYFANETSPNWSPSNELHRIAADLNGTPLQLTNDSNSDGDVRVCCPADQLVFAKWTSGMTDPRIFTCATDGSNAQQLVTEAVRAESPFCAPDGGTIVYTRYTSATAGALYQVDSSGAGTPVVLLDHTGPLADSVLLVDDWGLVDLPPERVLFTAHTEVDSELWMAHADGSNPVQLTDADGRSRCGRFSPDGLEVAFVSSRDGAVRVYLMDLADRSPAPIFTTAVENVWHAERAWSPDGTELAVKIVLGTAMRITVIDRQGHVLRSRDFAGRTNAAFDWSDDGQWLVYANETNPNSSPSNELYRLGSDLAGTPARLTFDSISDGDVRIATGTSKLVFNKYISGYADPRVFVANYDGSAAQQLVAEAVQAERPLANPAGDVVIYSRFSSGTDAALYAAPMDGTSGPVPFIDTTGPLAGMRLYAEDWAPIHVELTLLAPNGGEKRYAGPTCGSLTIAWQSLNAGPMVDLSYSTDNGATWNAIATVANNGSYEWVLPQLDSDQCLVRVADAADNALADNSDAPFATYPATDLIADFDGDCWVGLVDLGIFSSQWLHGNPAY